VYQDLVGIHGVELASGAETFAVAHDGLTPVAQVELGQWSATLTASQNRVYGATEVPLGRQVSAKPNSSLLWGIDLRRDGAVALQISSGEATVAFAGAPLVEDDKLFVALRSNDRTARAGMACYDRASGKRLWQHWLCQANTPATAWSRDVVTTLLTMDAGRIYLVTNLGAVAAVRADDGQVHWIHTYDRIAVPLTAAGSCAYYRGPNPGIYHHGRLYALPTDSSHLLAFDAVTGSLLWRLPITSNEALLVGASAGKLLLADDGLKILDAHTGSVLSTGDAPALRGRAVIAGERILWPSAGEIHVLDLHTGKSIAPALSLPDPGQANLALAKDYLIATQPHRLTVFRRSVPAPVETNISQLP
ncbi:MAG: PQQ-like beta-propeller repeat protein, partial [Pirellulales bacterium]|nr:PQQ-like beta-propeller repeat protein [Pirellulales bacterium]